MKVACFIFLVSILEVHSLGAPDLPPEPWHPSVSPPQVLYIYNEIQMRISRTVSMPRVAVWILLTLISWIMLIFTLSAHRQQTLHDTGVVTAASVWLTCVCVYACTCVLAWLPCFQIDLHVKGRTNYITYANVPCMFECTHTYTPQTLTTKVKTTVWALPGKRTTCQNAMYPIQCIRATVDVLINLLQIKSGRVKLGEDLST